MIIFLPYLALACKLRIGPFQIVENGNTFDRSIESEDGWLIVTSVSQFYLKFSEEGLRIDPVPANVLVAAFTEDRLVYHSQPHSAASPIVFECSEVVVLTHAQATLELAQIQGHLDGHSSCTKDEFLTLVRANTSQDWALIEAKFEKPVGRLRKEAEIYCGICCGAGNYFRTRPIAHAGFILALFTVGVLLTLLFGYIFHGFLGQSTPPPLPLMTYNGCGQFNENDTRAQTSFLVHDNREGWRLLQECGERLNISFKFGGGWICPGTRVSCD